MAQPPTERPAEAGLTRSSRDRVAVAAQIADFLADRLPNNALPEVALRGDTSANGMSSETLVLDASWEQGGRRSTHRLVARIAPAPGDVPVFPNYRLDHQFEVMREVATQTSVPVPPVL